MMATTGKRCLALADGSGIGLMAYPYPTGYNAYVIGWDRLDDPMKVLRWIHHLTGKTWFTAEMCAELIDATTEHFGWDRGEL